MKEKIRRFLPVGLVVAIAIAGLFFPRHAVVIDIEARGSVERVGQVNFITSEMDPVINMGVLGNRMDLDADNDTSIRASADNTLDFEVAASDQLQLTDQKITLSDASAADYAMIFDGNAQDYYIAIDDGTDDLYIGFGSAVGTDHVISIDENADMKLGEDQALTFSQIPAANAAGDLLDFTATLGTSDGATDDFIFFDINLTGSATEAARDVVGIDLALTDGADTDYLPFGIKIGAGWDTYLMMGPAGDGLIFTEIPIASAGGDSIDFTETLNTSDGATDDYIFLDINITGSGTEAARDAVGIDLGFTEGADADIIGKALEIQTGWDHYIDVDSETFLFKPVPAANAGGDSIDFTDTLGTSDGADDDYIFMDINITGAATEAARDVVGLDLDFVDGADTDSLAYAIELQSGWDSYLYVDSGTLDFKPVPAANSTGDSIDFTDTLASTDGTDHYKFMDINITEGAAATGTDTIMGIDLAFTADDGDSVTSALAIQSGWDHDINGIGDLIISVDSVATLTITDKPAANAGGDIIDVTQTLGVSDGVDDDFILLDANLTSSGTEEARDVDFLNLNYTDGADVDAIGRGLVMDAGFDQWIVLVGDTGAGVVWQPIPAANAAGDSIDFTDTLGTSDGADDDYIFLDVNLTGSATEAARDVVGIDLTLTDGADTDYLPFGLKIGAGWDTFIQLGPAGDGHIWKEIPVANAGGDSYDFTDTLGTSDGVDDDYIFMDVNLTGSATEAARDVIGIDLTLTDGADTDYLPFGLKISAGFDTYIQMGGAGDGLIFKEIPAANSTGDTIDFTDTLAAMDGTDVYIFEDINITLGAATGSGNTITVLDIAGITDDAQAITTAIKVGDEWNYALDTSAPVISTSQQWFDDFIGDTVNATYTEISGADAEAVQAIVEEQFGVYQLTSGDVGDTPANDLEGITLSLEWQADQGSLVMEVRLHMDSAVTTSAMCVGLSDDVATVEMPFIIGGGDAVTSNASDAVCFCYDTDAATDQWFFLGVAGDTDATGNAATGIAPAGDTYQVLRIEIDAAGGDARGYINGTEVGTLTANAVTATTLLAPWVGVDSHTNSSMTVDIDYIAVAADRD